MFFLIIYLSVRNVWTYILSQEYSALFEGAGNNPGEKTLEDRFFEHEVGLNHLLKSFFVSSTQLNDLLWRREMEMIWEP